MNKLQFSLGLIIVSSMLLISGCSDDDDASSASGSSSSSGSLGDSNPTGRISADGFFMLFDPAVPEVFDSATQLGVTPSYTQQEVTVSIFAEDVNDLAELNGQTVNFRVQWGAFTDERDSCRLENGTCSVTWRSGNPVSAPGSCFVAITAWAEGEEGFVDTNDNDRFDAGEALFDQDEPFLDINGNGTWTNGIATGEGVVELIDVIDFTGTTPGSKDGTHTLGNNAYDGSLCGTATNCSGRSSVIISTRAAILVQDPFEESDVDFDLDGSTDDTVTYCGPNAL